MFNDKVILITGGTGSFGKTLVKTLLTKNKQKPKKVIIFSRDEKKQYDMRIKFSNKMLSFIIGDIRDGESINLAMDGVDYVFHAAALKQVPSCEFFPMQAVLTNIIGSNNVIGAAIKHGVKKIVCLGTDKAVYPVNAMGMTKAIMEKLAHAFARGIVNDSALISSVRYGNVMYSRGSVIPLFIQQIKNNQPITITEPSMTRFMLSLDKAIDLVLFAFSNAKQGDIFIRKAPACTVLDLANALKNIFKSNVPISTIGVRHGEKIFETLMTKEEYLQSEDLGDYFRIGMDCRDLDYGKYYTVGDKKNVQIDDYTSHNTQRLNITEVENLLLSLPEVLAELKDKK
ncbi:MAG: polysaccharide biosynthesis protein [Gammaproteobacteria bacterium]|nr:polysaccharide biosynthesis protein [Gammaproteobacteria bacterium]